MKLNKLLQALAACLILTFTACDTGDYYYPDLDFSIYQQYEVYIQDGSKAVFANFRENNAYGARYRLDGDMKISYNGNKLYYTPSQTENIPEFNYSSYIETDTKEVEFEFRCHKGVTLKNSIYFADIANVTLDNDGSKELVNGKEYKYTVNGRLKDTDNVHVSLVPTVAGNDAKVYQANIFPISGKFMFTDVPAGRYTLRLDVYRVEPTTENDGLAAGSMRVIRRKTVLETIVKDE